MKKIINILWIIAFLLSLLLPGCALFHGDKWTTQDKVLETTWQIAHAVDWGQTLYISDHPTLFHENSFVLGEHPSRSEVNIYMAAETILHPVVTNYLPRDKKILGVPIRTWWQSITIVRKVDLVRSNYMLGIKLAY